MIFNVSSKPNDFTLSFWANREVIMLFSFLPFLLAVLLADFAKTRRFKEEGKEKSLNGLR